MSLTIESVMAFANAGAGDREADSSPPWERWYEAHRDALRRYLRRSLGRERELAEDLLQDVYVHALKGGARLPAGEDPRPWLFRIATNLLIDHYRRSSRRPDADASAAETADPARGPEEQAIREDMRRKIRDAIARLPEAQREVFLLREYGDVPFREIALRTGAPMGTVLARMRYAMLRVRSEVERGGAARSRALARGAEAESETPGEGGWS